jgi:recombination protein RecA
VGARTKVKIVKNKVAAPFKTTEFDIIYNEGISKEGELLALGEKFKLIGKSGSSYSYGEVKLGRGYDASRTFLRENPDVSKEIENKVRVAFESGASIEMTKTDPEENEEPSEE